MTNVFDEAVALKVARLHDGHPQAAPSLALFRVVQGFVGTEVDANTAWLQPGTPFGQVLAEVYDQCMKPREWFVWSRPPTAPTIRHALALVWRTQVLGPFAECYGLTLVGDLPPEPPGLHEEFAREAPAASLPTVDAWDLYRAGELLADAPFSKVAELVLRRPPGAGLFDTWNLGRPASNDTSWTRPGGSGSRFEPPGRQHLPDGST